MAATHQPPNSRINAHVAIIWQLINLLWQYSPPVASGVTSNCHIGQQ